MESFLSVCLAVDVAEAAAEDAQHREGEEWNLLDHELEAALVDRDERAIGAGDCGGRARPCFDEGHFAKETVFADDLDAGAANLEIHFATFDDEHRITGVASIEDDLTRRELEWLGVGFEDIGEFHGGVEQQRMGLRWPKWRAASNENPDFAMLYQGGRRLSGIPLLLRHIDADRKYIPDFNAIWIGLRS